MPVGFACMLSATYNSCDERLQETAPHRQAVQGPREGGGGPIFHQSGPGHPVPGWQGAGGGWRGGRLSNLHIYIYCTCTCTSMNTYMYTYRAVEVPEISRNFAKYETKWALSFGFVSFRFVSFSSEYTAPYFVSFRFPRPLPICIVLFELWYIK